MRGLAPGPPGPGGQWRDLQTTGAWGSGPRPRPGQPSDPPEQVLLLTSSAEGPASAPWPWPSTMRSSSWEVPERDIPPGQDSDWNCGWGPSERAGSGGAPTAQGWRAELPGPGSNFMGLPSRPAPGGRVPPPWASVSQAGTAYADATVGKAVSAALIQDPRSPRPHGQDSGSSLLGSQGPRARCSPASRSPSCVPPPSASPSARRTVGGRHLPGLEVLGTEGQTG